MKFIGMLRPRFIGIALFWSWSFIFAVFIFAGLGPTVLAALLQAAYFGDLPWDYVLFTLLLGGLPLVFIPIGLWMSWLRPERMLALFYGLEAPLLTLCLVRLFLLRQLNPATTLMLVLIAAAFAGFAYDLMRSERRSAPAAWQLVVACSGAVVAVHIGVLLAFYTVPLGWKLLETFFSGEFWLACVKAVLEAPAAFFMAVVFGGGLFFYSATLFVGLPYAMVALYAAWWRRMVRAFAMAHGWKSSVAISCVAFAGIAASFLYAGRQPQGWAFELLAEPVTGGEDLRTRLDESAAIRRGLLNAYLAPYRYVSSTGENQHIATIYRKTFDAGPETARVLQDAYDFFAAPLLYDGASLRADSRRAEALYESFFDSTIQEGERVAIRDALNATHDRDGIEAGLLDVGERNVRLVSQVVRVDARGDWAEIDVHEEYENDTREPQEVLYYFTLPESAVVTGLWLGTSSDRKSADRFAVSPRGAAQRVYRAQVREVRDPSLLEQVGPYHYRLRAFPIPPRPGQGSAGLPPARMHLWFRYRVLAADGSWPLPALIEARNVYWDARTVRIGAGVTGSGGTGEGWLERQLPAPMTRRDHAHRLEGGTTVRVVPLEDAGVALPSGRRYAVVLDRSFSMERVRDELAASIVWLRDEIEPGNDVDLYLTSATTRGEQPRVVEHTSELDERSMVFYGGQKSIDLLRQFRDLSGGRSYEAVVVLTDAAGFALAATHEEAVEVAMPVWVVQLGEGESTGFDDSSIAAIQMHGGAVVRALPEVFERLEVARRHGVTGADAMDGYVWRIEVGSAATAAHDDDGFAALAARFAIGAAMRSRDATDLAAMAAVHRIAQRYEVVSPYSSMIVLVDDRQRAELAAAEQRDDRFARAVESGMESLSTPFDPFATSSGIAATPEPEEWMLMIVASILLAVSARMGWLRPTGRPFG